MNKHIVLHWEYDEGPYKDGRWVSQPIGGYRAICFRFPKWRGLRGRWTFQLRAEGEPLAGRPFLIMEGRYLTRALAQFAAARELRNLMAEAK